MSEAPLASARRAAASALASYCGKAADGLGQRTDDLLTSGERANLIRAFRDLEREMRGRARGPR